MLYSKRNLVSIACFASLILAPLAFSQQLNEALEPKLEGEAVIDLLSSGLDEWIVPSKHWSIGGYAIVANTGDVPLEAPEWIYTKRQFSDFEMTCEMRLTGDESRNTGVYFRASFFMFTEKKRGLSYEAASGYEFDAGFHRPGKKNLRGSLGDWYARPYLRIFPDQEIIDEVYKSEDWNGLTIRARGKRIEYWLNGVKIMDYRDEDPKAARKGAIGFQVHNGAVMKVEYRNIRVLPLS